MTVYILECVTTSDILGAYSSLEWAQAQLLGDWTGDDDEGYYLIAAGDGERFAYMITPRVLDEKVEVKS